MSQTLLTNLKISFEANKQGRDSKHSTKTVSLQPHSHQVRSHLTALTIKFQKESTTFLKDLSVHQRSYPQTITRHSRKPNHLTTKTTCYFSQEIFYQDCLQKALLAQCHLILASLTAICTKKYKSRHRYMQGETRL